MKNHLLIILVGLFLVVALVCGCASAVELTVGTPIASEGADNIFKVPVILKNDVDFAAFTASVKTNVPGVSITLDSERPLEDWNLVSKDTGDAINVVAYSLGSTTEAEVHLFTLDVKITDPKVTNVPLDLTLYTVGLADNSILPVDQIKTTNLDNFKLSDTVSATVTTDVEEYIKPTPVPTSTPAVVETRTETGVPTTISTVVSTQNPVASETGTATASPTAVPTKTKASSPGFTIVASLLGVLGAGILLKNKFR